MNDGVGDGQLEMCRHIVDVTMLYVRFMAELCSHASPFGDYVDDVDVSQPILVPDQMDAVMTHSADVLMLALRIAALLPVSHFETQACVGSVRCRVVL